MVFDYSLTPGRTLFRPKELIENQSPVISIITAYYNDEKHIFETANSVLNQTYPYFEWIIVNDGSTSFDSPKVLADLADLDSRIKILHKINTGPADTRDYGANHSNNSSKYLLFLDSDDLLNPTYLECAYWTLETNAKASFAYTDLVNFGEQNFLWRKWFELQTEKKDNMLVLTALIRKEDFFAVNRI